MSHSLFSTNPLVSSNVENPFLRDYTGQLEKVSESYTNLINRECKAKPYVLSIDAPWGIGKTAFIDMWGQSLLNKKELAVKFDTWKNDYSDYPLYNFMSEILKQLSDLDPKSITLEKLKQVTATLLKNFIPITLKHSALWIASLIKIDKPIRNIGCELSDPIKNNFLNDIESYDNGCNTLNDFKNLLREITQNRTLFIFIDELDRAKPTFAVAILEIVKHFFDIDNVCCLLVTHKKALSQSIGAFYGYDQYLSNDYLERFVDLYLNLPEPNLSKFIDYKWDKIQFYFEDDLIKHSLLEFIKLACTNARLNLRVVEKVLRDIHLFLLFKNVETENEIPEIYYTCIVYQLISNRISNPLQHNNFSGCIRTESKLHWIHAIFNSSYSEASLNSEITKLIEKIQLMDANSTLQDSEQLKDIFPLEDVIIDKIYGGVNKIKTSREPNNAYTYRVKNYKNHFKNAERIINFMNIPTEVQNEIFSNKLES
jgi:hypothetical protein